MDVKNLVCINDGSGTRITFRDNTVSAIDLTLASNSLAGVCLWQVINKTTIGSDHCPIMTEIKLNIQRYCIKGIKKRCFRSADLETFRNSSEIKMQKVDMNSSIDDLNFSICYVRMS